MQFPDILITNINKTQMEPKLNVLITGDIICDRHILEGTKKNASSTNEGTKIIPKTGGAGLSWELTEGVLDAYILFLQSSLRSTPNTEKKKYLKKKIEFLKKNKPSTHPGFEKKACNSDNQLLESFINWTRHKKTKAEDPKEWDSVYLGYGNQLKDVAVYKSGDLIKKSDLIVIDEANLGFRDQTIDTTNKYVVLKMSYPFCGGKLWQKLVGDKNTLITIVNLNNLRKYDVKVSKGISWEQTALDLAFELTNNKQLKELLKSDHLIVSIGSAGALYIKKGVLKNEAEFQLIFDPECMEDEWENDNGSTVGTGSAFIAGFILKYIDNFIHYHTEDKGTEKNYQPEIQQLVKTGLNAIRIVSKHGLFVTKEQKNQNPYQYPFHALAKVNSDNPFYYSSVFVPSPWWSLTNGETVNPEYLKNNDWSILANNYFPEKLKQERLKQLTTRNSKVTNGNINREETLTNPKPFFELARDVARFGPLMVQYAPKIKFGNFVSFDRNEIESLRNIKKLMLDYYHHEKGERPLNIAIFGPPGAGKSFAVKQIAKSVINVNNIQILDYNLSQFSNPDELAGVFHSIRDVVLAGKLPIVFWDEFDSEELRWLKELIAPMQDGVFQESGVSHPLGKCIFFFAGGTSYSMSNFDPQNRYPKEIQNSKLKKKKEQDEQNFKLKKGPDFISRINGYLNVLGPNRRLIYSRKTMSWQEDPLDVCFPVRRAVFIRGVLRLKDGEELHMDWGLLSAFLEISGYKRGSRSLERLLHQLTLNNNDKFIRSNLPSDEVIGMNVDYDEFIQLMYKDRTAEKFNELVAKEIHKTWTGNKAVENNIFNVFWGKLSYDMRLANIEAASRIKNVVNSSEKFEVVPGMEGDTLKEHPFSRRLAFSSDFLDKLAEKEHELWCDERKNAGWIYNSLRSNYLKHHDCLMKFSQLDLNENDREKQTQKNKDRTSVKNFVEYLKDSGFQIIQVTQ